MGSGWENFAGPPGEKEGTLKICKLFAKKPIFAGLSLQPGGKTV